MTDVFNIPAVPVSEKFFCGAARRRRFRSKEITYGPTFGTMSRSGSKAIRPRKFPGRLAILIRCTAKTLRSLKLSGIRPYRFGIEWARIEPEEGVFNEEATDHYVQQLVLLKEKGIRTFVTLIHKTVPQWFRLKGGFNVLDNRRYFERYLHYILPKIAQYVDFWNVLNEFNLWLSEDGMKRKQNSLLFHALGYRVIKRYSSAPVSSAHALVMYFAKRQFDPFDQAAAHYFDVVDNEFFFHAIRTGEIVLRIPTRFSTKTSRIPAISGRSISIPAVW